MDNRDRWPEKLEDDEGLETHNLFRRKKNEKRNVCQRKWQPKEFQFPSHK